MHWVMQPLQLALKCTHTQHALRKTTA